MKDEKRAVLADVGQPPRRCGDRSRQVAGRRTEILGLGVVAYTPNPVGRVHPGVRHARKPGDPFGKGFSNLDCRPDRVPVYGPGLRRKPRVWRWSRGTTAPRDSHRPYSPPAIPLHPYTRKEMMTP